MNKQQLSILLFSGLGFIGCDPLKPVSKDPLTQEVTSGVNDRDNSSVNQRDHASTAKTPLDQNENQADIDITAGIRKRVVDTRMSINAQNVKIITQNGVVTLRGPVKNQEEKKRIEEIARSVAGVKSVDSQLEVELNP